MLTASKPRVNFTFSLIVPHNGSAAAILEPLSESRTSGTRGCMTAGGTRVSSRFGSAIRLVAFGVGTPNKLSGGVQFLRVSLDRVAK